MKPLQLTFESENSYTLVLSRLTVEELQSFLTILQCFTETSRVGSRDHTFADTLILQLLECIER